MFEIHMEISRLVVLIELNTDVSRFFIIIQTNIDISQCIQTTVLEQRLWGLPLELKDVALRVRAQVWQNTQGIAIDHPDTTFAKLV